MKFLTIKPGHKTTLVDKESLPGQVHLFDEKSISAINAALAARRPLLIRGEPGVGKSQLARAAAKELKRAFVAFVIDSRTEARDLLWEFDAVARLAEAQLAGALQDKDLTKVRAELAIANFIKPGPLWWAFDWDNAVQQAEQKTSAPPQYDGGDPKNGVVVLIDEIDKAESDVPNGLLEALGIAEFTPQGHTEPITVQGEEVPLIIITSNEERVLPDAFVRRCLVFNIELPSQSDELKQWLIERGKAHFKEISETVLQKAAELLVADRKATIEQNLFPRPGQAEYLDLVRAVQALAKSDDEAGQLELLKNVSRFTLNKHQGAS